MLKIKEKLLLTYFLKKNRIVSIQELATDFRISERKAYMFIQDFNYFGKKNGVSLKNKRNDGYLLTVTNEEKLQKFKDSSMNQIVFIDPHHRQLLIQIYITRKIGYTSINELSEYVGASKSTISADLKFLNTKMEKFHLKIVGKTYYGMEVVGSELNKRLCLIKALNLLPIFERDKYIEDLLVQDTFRSELRHLFGEYKIVLTETIFLTIVQYITIMITRLKENQQISATPVSNMTINTSQFIDFTTAIKNLLQEWYDIDLPDQEQKYLINYIVEQTIVFRENDLYFDTFTKNSLIKMDQFSGLNFAKNSLLQGNLSKHLVSLKSRIDYGSQILFPNQKQFYSENLFTILLSYLFLLNIQSDIDLNKITIDEVMYLAVYFEAALLQEEDIFNIHKKRIVVMAETRSVGFFLKEKLQYIYPNMSITIFDDINILSIRENIKKFDLVITTKSIGPEERKIHPSIIEIKDFLSLNEQKILTHKIIELFEWNTFKDVFLFESPDLKDSQSQENYTLKDWNSMISKKYPFIVIDNFLTIILKPSKMNQTFLKVQPLNENIVWKDKQVAAILTIHYQKGDIKQLKMLCDVVQILYADKTLNSQFKHCQTFTEFLSIVKEAFLQLPLIK